MRYIDNVQVLFDNKTGCFLLAKMNKKGISQWRVMTNGEINDILTYLFLFDTVFDKDLLKLVIKRKVKTNEKNNRKN